MMICIRECGPVVVWGGSSRVLFIQESVTIYHSESVETILPGVCFHSDGATHHRLSAACAGMTAHLISDEGMHAMIDEDTWE